MTGFFCLLYFQIMRRFFATFFGIAFLLAIVSAWIFLGSGTGFSETKKALYIRSSGATQEAVLDSIHLHQIVRNETLFKFLANRLHYWSHIKPGKYEFQKGTSLLTILRTLRNGSQTPVKLTITKIRTKEDLAKMVGNRFECDSLQMISFLNNKDSLSRFNVNADEALTLVLPDTYTFNWNTTPSKIMKKMADVSDGFWTKERAAKAKSLGLTPVQVYTLASIVEEETNAAAEKGNIASVYMNRLHKGAPLQADPTIKFAMKDFSIKRIYEKYLFVESPYNTYRNKGLPPGPICTPSRKTIDAVLNAPKTNYLFFVASPDSIGVHTFSATYAEHLQKAKSYHNLLNRRDSIKQAQSPHP